MKNNALRYISTVFVMLLVFGAVEAQDEPKAVLVDEFGRLQCGDMIARFDGLMQEVKKDAKSVGVAIIHIDPNDLKSAMWSEVSLRGQAEFRSFDDKDFVLIKATGNNGTSVRLWKLPFGAELSEHTPFDPPLGTATKPFVFNRTKDDVGSCPIGHQFRRYADTLRSYPSGRGHVVIWARNRKEFEKEKQFVEESLVKKYSIEKNKIRYFFFRHTSEFPSWEYWVVPKTGK